MGKLFDFDNFDLEKVLLDPIKKPIEGTISAVKNIADGDFGAILGDNQDISTEALKNLGFNPDNKLVKNSDAIAGTIIGGILAAPAIGGMLGGSGAGAGAGTSAGNVAGGSMFNTDSLIRQGVKMGMNRGKGAKKQQPTPPPQIPTFPTGGSSGQLGTGLSYDELMRLF